jgi:hypothetical protein
MHMSNFVFSVVARLTDSHIGRHIGVCTEIPLRARMPSALCSFVVSSDIDLPALVPGMPKSRQDPGPGNTRDSGPGAPGPFGFCSLFAAIRGVGSQCTHGQCLRSHTLSELVASHHSHHPSPHVARIGLLERSTQVCNYSVMYPQPHGSGECHDNVGLNEYRRVISLAFLENRSRTISRRWHRPPAQSIVRSPFTAHLAYSRTSVEIQV